jgi:hypothetical protein
MQKCWASDHLVALRPSFIGYLDAVKTQADAATLELK